MAPVVENNIEKIIEACKLMQVKSLHVFGSAARGNDFSSESDIDFLYSMEIDEQGLTKGNFDYFDLLWKLEEITGRKVDLVADKKIRNKYFAESIASDKVKVYEA
ncbi:MAG: nucleotidyltransferase domain-containing protein [Chitinophagaceae bacterium]|nr:nucleotidyltransferase domain-containing protein [Chitinophagaceae bacterium]